MTHAGVVPSYCFGTYTQKSRTVPGKILLSQVCLVTSPCGTPSPRGFPAARPQKPTGVPAMPLRSLVALVFLGTLTGAARPEQPVSFTRDVEPVLTKAGCNAGSCHGAQHGRGGFRLSLFAFD